MSRTPAPRSTRFLGRLALGCAAGFILATSPPWSVPERAPKWAVQAAPVSQPTVGYRLADTWSPVWAGPAMQRAPWPAGHSVGGVASQGGRVYATDREVSAVRVFQDGREIAVWDGRQGAANGLGEPAALAALPDGRFAVADVGGDRVLLLNHEGVTQTQWRIDGPRGMTVYDTGAGPRIGVISGPAREIIGLDPDGGIERRISLSRLGRPDSLAWGGLMGLGGATFYVGDALPFTAGVYQVNDLGSSRFDLTDVGALAAPPLGGASFQPIENLLVHLDGEGLVSMAQIDSVRKGTASALALGSVVDLAIDNDSFVHVAVKGVGVMNIGRLDALEHDLRSQRTGPAGPQAVDVGAELVLVGGHARVHGWHVRGTWAWEAPLARETVDVASAGEATYVLDGDGVVHRFERGTRVGSSRRMRDSEHHVVALSAAGRRVAVLDLRAQEVRMLDSSLRPTAILDLAPDGSFRGAVDVALAERHVFIARAGAGVVEVRDMDGRPVAEIAIPSGANRVAAGPEGDAYTLSSAGWVVRARPDGTVVAAWPVGSPAEVPVDLGVDDAGRVFVADGGGAVRVYEAHPDAAPAIAPSAAAHCSVLPNKGALPSAIVLGEEVEVSLTLDGSCPREERRSDVVLAIDRSGSMRGAKLAAAREAALSFTARTDPLLARIAVVAFAGRAERLLDLTSERVRIIDALLGLDIEGWTDIVGGLSAARDALVDGQIRPGTSRVILFLTDGRHWDPARGEIVDPPGLLAIADQLRAEGIIVYAVGLGDDTNATMLRTLATDEAHYLRSPTPVELRSVYREIARRIEAVELMRTVSVRDSLPADMAWVAGSGRPAEPHYDAATHSLSWTFQNVPEPGLHLRYRLRPTALGDRPISVETVSEFVDGFGNAGRVVHPVPYVAVRAPSPTPRPEPHRIWLPVAVRDTCPALRMHVVLLVDTSSSMAGPAAAGPDAQDKLSAARRAVLRFAGAMESGRDDLSVLRFDGETELVARGPDRRELAAALDRLGPRPGTRMDRALAAAESELRTVGAWRSETTRAVVVLLTDGVPQAGTADATTELGARLRSAEVTLHAVAFGPDPDPVWLEAVVGAGHVSRAVDGGQLVDLYDHLARSLRPCPQPWAADAPRE